MHNHLFIQRCHFSKKISSSIVKETKAILQRNDIFQINKNFKEKTLKLTIYSLSLVTKYSYQHIYMIKSIISLLIPIPLKNRGNHQQEKCPIFLIPEMIPASSTTVHCIKFQVLQPMLSNGHFSTFSKYITELYRSKLTSVWQFKLSLDTTVLKKKNNNKPCKISMAFEKILQIHWLKVEPLI